MITYEEIKEESKSAIDRNSFIRGAMFVINKMNLVVTDEEIEEAGYARFPGRDIKKTENEIESH